MASAEAFAKQILYWASQTKDEPMPITHMQLQKLLYYVQGWSLAAFDTPAFNSSVEAWKHGPVVADVYPLFRESGSRPLDPVTEASPDLDDRQRALVEWVMDQYGRYSASYLRRLTHAERPWRTARGTLSEDEPGTTEISVHSMKAFFQEEQDKQLRRHGLTLEQLLDLHERAAKGASVPFDEFVGRGSRAG